eukprot:scaffold2113_cov233-Pinguiococcus_pyrenoidosus.AAC.14
MPASRTKLARSAPEKPSSRLSRPSVSRYFLSRRAWEIRTFLQIACKMSPRASGPGNGTRSSLSRRPGRSMAGSIMSGLLVAAMTKTLLRASAPSISVSSWFTTLSLTPEPPSVPTPRFGQIASSSSKKITQGADSRARWKTCLTALSDSPTYLSSSSGPLTLMKFALLSAAQAFANRVFPQPGGPQSRTPAGTVRPSRRNRSGLSMGSTTLSSSSSRTSWSAPTSSQVTSGCVAKPSRLALGCTLGRAV